MSKLSVHWKRHYTIMSSCASEYHIFLLNPAEKTVRGNFPPLSISFHVWLIPEVCGFKISRCTEGWFQGSSLYNGYKLNLKKCFESWERKALEIFTWRHHWIVLQMGGSPWCVFITNREGKRSWRLFQIKSFERGNLKHGASQCLSDHTIPTSGWYILQLWMAQISENSLYPGHHSMLFIEYVRFLEREESIAI